MRNKTKTKQDKAKQKQKTGTKQGGKDRNKTRRNNLCTNFGTTILVVQHNRTKAMKNKQSINDMFMMYYGKNKTDDGI